MACPKGLDIGGNAQTPEAGDVLIVDKLDVGDVMHQAGIAIRVPCQLNRVESVANGPVSDRMEMALEAKTVQDTNYLAQSGRPDEVNTGVAGGAASAIQVGLEHGRREVLGDAIEHQLDAGRSITRAHQRPTAHQLFD